MKDWLSSRRPVADRVLMIVLIATVAVTGSLTVLEHRRSDRLAKQGGEAHDAICTLRGDLEQRVAVTRKFLEEHPAGFGDFDVDMIRNSLASQQQTVDALSGIHCDTEGARP